MKLTPELTWLAIIAAATALMWVPYVLESFVSRGILATMGNPSPDDPPAAGWACRAKRAHMNALENLAAFAALVLAAALAGISTPATVLAAKVYTVARLGHYIVYAAGIPVIRTLLFLIGVGATLVIASAILGAAS
jgi:uncharacterized MAPEG superfamily protein